MENFVKTNFRELPEMEYLWKNICEKGFSLPNPLNFRPRNFFIFMAMAFET